MNAINTALLRLPEVEKITGLKRATIYRHASEGRFPKQIKLTNSSSAWIASEVEEWVQSRIAESRAA